MAQISYFGNPAGNTITGGNSVVLYGFTPVPEPALTLAVCVAGLGGWHAWRRRRDRRPTGWDTPQAVPGAGSERP
jgi:hypothetical protein